MRTKLFFRSVLIFLATLLLASCGSSGGGGSAGSTGDISSKLVGTWKIDCRSTGIFFTVLTEIRNDGTLTNRIDFFSDASCATPTGSAQISEQSFVIGKEVTTKNGFIAREFDVINTKLTIDGVEQQISNATIYFILRLEGDTLYSTVPGVYLTPETRATELDFDHPAVRQ